MPGLRGGRAAVRGPPPEGFHGPWQGYTEIRITPQGSRPMPVGEPSA